MPAAAARVDSGHAEIADGSDPPNRAPRRYQRMNLGDSRGADAMASAWSRGDQRARPTRSSAAIPASRDEAADPLIYEEVCLRRDLGAGYRDDRSRQPLSPLEGRAGGPARLRPDAAPVLAAWPMFPRWAKTSARSACWRSWAEARPARRTWPPSRRWRNRLVVLKVISDDQEEHLSLARLQHTHIIPLFSEHTFPDAGPARLVHALPGRGKPGSHPGGRRCNPARATAGPRHHSRPRPSAGRGRPDPIPLPTALPPLHRAEASYVQAICWIGACLADALHEAHAPWPGAHGCEAVERPDRR